LHRGGSYARGTLGWVALIAAISVLFVASSQDQSSNNKMASLLRQELKSTHAERIVR